jgi:hypothetical protein
VFLVSGLDNQATDDDIDETAGSHRRQLELLLLRFHALAAFSSHNGRSAGSYPQFIWSS